MMMMMMEDVGEIGLQYVAVRAIACRNVDPGHAKGVLNIIGVNTIRRCVAAWRRYCHRYWNRSSRSSLRVCEKHTTREPRYKRIENDSVQPFHDFYCDVDNNASEQYLFRKICVRNRIFREYSCALLPTCMCWSGRIMVTNCLYFYNSEFRMLFALITRST